MMRNNLFILITATWLTGLFHPTMAQEDQCQEFTREIFIDGQKQQGYGTACLGKDGNWVIQGEQGNPEEDQIDSSSAEYRIVPPAHDIEQNTVITNPSPRIYRSQSLHYGVGIGRGASSLYIGESYPRYYDEDYYPYYRCDRDPYRRHFYRYHHGPGWNKHWQQHRRVLRD